MSPQSQYKVIEGISQKCLEEILSSIKKVKAALIGDICLDIYWRADMTKSELSRETPHFPLPVVEEWMSPGGGGNAAANIAALNPARIVILGVIGDDWRGNLLLSELKRRNIDTSGVIKSVGRVTNTYCKPIRKGISDVEYEDPRIDFENFKSLNPEDEHKLMTKLEQISKDIDVLCVTDQMRFGCITPALREKIIELSLRGLKVVVDSRDRIAFYKNVILKPNNVEAYKALNKNEDPKDADISELIETAMALSEKGNSPVCMTLGPKGSIYVENGEACYIPSPEVKPPFDPCGAGDTFLSAFSCAIALGARGYEAATVANIAASITVKKIGMTGVATPGEIYEAAKIYSAGENNR